MVAQPHNFSLISEAWLPYRRLSGERGWARPAEVLAASEDPVVAVAWGRADFDGAVREFLIGLIAVAYRDVLTDHGDEVGAWRRHLQNAPALAELDARFAALEPAFFLGGAGARFGQDFTPFGGDPVPIAQLLIDSPGANTLKKNQDHFVKRGRAACLGASAAAMALFTLQTYAPSGGQGHRTSLRGGGPLTVIAAASRAVSLWDQLAPNCVVPGATGSDDRPLDGIFPWLRETPTSEKGQTVTPQQADPLQAYWGMPRRIRLHLADNQDGTPCALTGRVEALCVRTYETRNYGISYVGFQHPLSPYSFAKASGEFLPVHGQPGRIGYRHWVGLVTASDDGARVPSESIRLARLRLKSSRGATARLTAFGYDMDNMKARDFTESAMPLLVGAPNVMAEADALIREMVRGADVGRFLLVSRVREALFGPSGPSDGSLLERLKETYWTATEQDFLTRIDGLMDRIAATLADDGEFDDDARDALRQTVRRDWLAALTRQIARLFDDLVVPDDAGVLLLSDMQRRAAQRRSLRAALAGYGKPGQDFYTALGLPAPKKQKAA